MDSDSVSHVMISKKLLTKADVRDINGFPDNNFRNSLILKHVMIMSTDELFCFCKLLLDMEHQQHLGTLLINGSVSYRLMLYVYKFPFLNYPIT